MRTLPFLHLRPEQWKKLLKTSRHSRSYCGELSVEDGFITEGNQIVIPPPLRKETLEHIYEEHIYEVSPKRPYQGQTNCILTRHKPRHWGNYKAVPHLTELLACNYAPDFETSRNSYSHMVESLGRCLPLRRKKVSCRWILLKYYCQIPTSVTSAAVIDSLKQTFSEYSIVDSLVTTVNNSQGSNLLYSETTRTWNMSRQVRFTQGKMAWSRALCKSLRGPVTRLRKVRPTRTWQLTSTTR